MRKIIFLDIDGVLNTSETLKHSHNGIVGIDPYRVLLLDRIIQATGAEIVLSSSWRHGFYEELKKSLAVPIIDKTGDSDTGIRGVEIYQWIEDNIPWDVGKGRVLKYAILDDDGDMLLWQKDHFFQTNFMGDGLTEAIAERVIAHLNDDKKKLTWKEARQNLKQTFDKFPSLILDVLDSAYLHGLEQNK